MTFQLQAYKAKAVPYAGPNRNRYWQYVDLLIASANTDTALDISSDTTGSLGTFWTAVTADATYGAVGSAALATVQNIVSVCKELREVTSEALFSRLKIGGAGSFQYFTSGVISTGTAVNATVTGLLATDVVISVTQATANANGVVPVAFGTPTSNTLPLTYESTSGANGTVSVLVFRSAATTTPASNQYSLSIVGHLPLITFNSGTAPTSQVLTLAWLMQDNVMSINADYGAAF